MIGRGVERLLRAADRFQQRHSFLAMPVGVIKKFGDDQAGKHAALLAYYGFLAGPAGAGRPGHERGAPARGDRGGSLLS